MKGTTQDFSRQDYTDFAVSIAMVRCDDYRKNRTGDAIEYIRNKIQKLGADKRLAEMKAGLINNWIATLINGNKPDEAIKVIEACIRIKAGKGDYIKFSSLAYQQSAALISDKKGELKLRSTSRM